jgi:hypothetical protein
LIDAQRQSKSILQKITCEPHDSSRSSLRYRPPLQTLIAAARSHPNCRATGSPHPKCFATSKTSFARASICASAAMISSCVCSRTKRRLAESSCSAGPRRGSARVVWRAGLATGAGLATASLSRRRSYVLRLIPSASHGRSLDNDPARYSFRVIRPRRRLREGAVRLPDLAMVQPASRKIGAGRPDHTAGRSGFANVIDLRVDAGGGPEDFQSQSQPGWHG